MTNILNQREQIVSAFFTLLDTSLRVNSGIIKASSRRYIPWTQAVGFPFLTIIRPGERRQGLVRGLPDVTLKVVVVIYTTGALDPNSIPDIQMNALLDAIDGTISPTSSDILAGWQQTLGGLAQSCFPVGEVVQINGDAEPDGIGMALIPFEIRCGDFVGVAGY
jgi:hypothetical protein